MASNPTNSLFILIAIMAALLSASITEARLLSKPPLAMSLRARLKLEGESSNCWDSLFQLQACSGEIITFFLNGETFLGSSCCQAIRIIGRECWPNIYSALGFTAEEGDILQGYCDEVVHSPPLAPISLEPNKVVP